MLAWRPRTLATALALAAAASPCDDEVSRFRLIESPDAISLERDLRAAAAEGFRVLDATTGRTFGGKPRIVALMERGAESSEAVEYAVLAPEADLEEEAAMGSLNAFGAAGFELTGRRVLGSSVDDWWLPETAYDAQLTLILERTSTPRRHAFRSVGFTDVESFGRLLAERGEEGFDALALVNTSRRVRALLARPLDEPARSRSYPDRYRVLFHATQRGLTRAMERAAARGYRLLAAADQSINAPPLLLLQASSEAHGYKLLAKPLEKYRADKLERKLNKHAARGFRVRPAGVTSKALVLERALAEPRVWHYRLLSSRRRPGLVRALDGAMRDGYRFVVLFADATEAIVLVENEMAPAARDGE